MNIHERNENGFYYRTWLADAPKAAIVLIHGISEHCKRYDHVAQPLTENGYSVYTMDLPSHGQSSGSRGDVDSFDLFTLAALKLHDTVRAEHPDLPLFILGHSLGGLIVSRFLLDHQDKFHAAALSAPAIKSPQEPSAWQAAILRMIVKVLPKTKLFQLDASGISKDPKVVDTYMNDPLINTGKVSARFLVGISDAIDAVKARAASLSLPLLLMHGTDDKVTSPEGSQWLYDAVSSQHKEIKLYSGLYHEIFNEPEQQQVFNDLIQWLDSRLMA